MDDLNELPSKIGDVAAQAAEFRLFHLDDKLKTVSIFHEFHEHLHGQTVSLIVRAKHENDIWEADVIQNNLNFVNLLRAFASSGEMPFYNDSTVRSFKNGNLLFIVIMDTVVLTENNFKSDSISLKRKL